MSLPKILNNWNSITANRLHSAKPANEGELGASYLLWLNFMDSKKLRSTAKFSHRDLISSIIIIISAIGIIIIIINIITIVIIIIVDK